ncbi:MAG: hypothetical protein ABII01_05690 [Candidatus Woesearchaeota archaeon]
MKLFKTMYNVGLIGLIFYSGMVYQRHRTHEEITQIKTSVERLDSIDFKVMSFIKEYAAHPERIEDTLEDLHAKYLGGGSDGK